MLQKPTKGLNRERAEVYLIFIKSLCKCDEGAHRKMNIFINGKVSEVKKNINIQDILRMNNIRDENIVVEINRTIISKIYWGDTRIQENDKIEIITAVGGG